MGADDQTNSVEVTIIKVMNVSVSVIDDDGFLLFDRWTTMRKVVDDGISTALIKKIRMLLDSLRR